MYGNHKQLTVVTTGAKAASLVQADDSAVQCSQLEGVVECARLRSPELGRSTRMHWPIFRVVPFARRLGGTQVLNDHGYESMFPRSRARRIAYGMAHPDQGNYIIVSTNEAIVRLVESVEFIVEHDG